MTEIISNIDGKLLHRFISKEDIKDGRFDISSSTEPLQLATLSLVNGQTFKPHYHIKNIRIITITQEAWVVIEGKIKVDYYDIDNKLVGFGLLGAGDCSITYRGGHNYTCLSKDALVYEFKTGPYLGQEKDKKFI